MIAIAAGLAETVSSLSPGAYLTLIVAVSVVCQWVAWRLKIPSILLLLLVGFGLGMMVTADEVLGREMLFDGVRLTVGVILFEGSLQLRLRHVDDLRKPVFRLCTTTVALAWAMITAAAWVLGFDIRVALLIGAILVVTGPTVIAPILRSLRPTRRVSALLRWEGIIVDPIGAVLALLVFQGVVGSLEEGALPAVTIALAKTLAVSIGVTAVLGVGLDQLMRRRMIPDFLHGVVFLAVAVTALVVSDSLQEESGLLTVTLLGVYLGNRPRLHLERVVEFKEHLQVLFVGALFVLLAGRVTPEQLVDVVPKALIFLVLLVLVVRPVSIYLGLWRTKVTMKERTLLAGMAPRGIVAAAVTSVFALSFGNAADRFVERAEDTDGAAQDTYYAHADQLAKLAEQAEQMVPLVFVVIVATVAIYGLSVGRLAERLGLASADPQGVLFVGASSWVIATATLLKEHKIPVRVVARNYASLADARMAGLDTMTANILSEYAVKDMDMSGLGTFLAATPEDETNATAAREFSHVFGTAKTYQLRRDARSVGTGSPMKDTAGHLSGRFAFDPPLSRAELDRRMWSGMTVKQTTLSPKFTLADFKEHYGEETVLLFFVSASGTVTVAGPEVRAPRDAGSVIAMVRVPAQEAAPTPPAGHTAQPAG